MNYLDIASVVVIMWATWTGLQRGLIRSFTSLIGWLLALVLGSRYAGDIAPYFSILTKDPVIQKIAGFAAITLAILFITSVIGNILLRFLKALRLGLSEKVAGGIFGAAKGSLILMIAIQLVGPWVSASPYWHKSRTVSLLSPYAPMAVDLSEHMASQMWDKLKSDGANQRQNQGHNPISSGTSEADEYDEPSRARVNSNDTVANPFS